MRVRAFLSALFFAGSVLLLWKGPLGLQGNGRMPGSKKNSIQGQLLKKVILK
jgi:hypothetical protein